MTACLFLTLVIIVINLRTLPQINSNTWLNSALYLLTVGLSFLFGYFGIQGIYGLRDTVGFTGFLGGIVFITVYGLIAHLLVKKIINHLSSHHSNY